MESNPPASFTNMKMRLKGAFQHEWIKTLLTFSMETVLEEPEDS